MSKCDLKIPCDKFQPWNHPSPFQGLLWLCFFVPPKSYNQHLGIDLERYCIAIWKVSTGLWHSNCFSISKWRPYPIWSSSQEGIRIFVKHVMGPFLPFFVTVMFLFKPKRGVELFIVLYKLQPYWPKVP